MSISWRLLYFHACARAVVAVTANGRSRPTPSPCNKHDDVQSTYLPIAHNACQSNAAGFACTYVHDRINIFACACICATSISVSNDTLRVLAMILVVIRLWGVHGFVLMLACWKLCAILLAFKTVIATAFCYCLCAHLQLLASVCTSFDVHEELPSISRRAGMR